MSTIRIRLVWAFIFFVLGAEGIAAPGIDWRVVTALDPYEPFEAHAFHDGHLWVGQSRQGLGASYRLEVFDPSGKQVATTELEHSPRFLYPYGVNSIITVGISYKTNLSHFSIVTRNGDRLSVQSKKIPLGALANEWAGKPGLLLFTDPGGFDDGSPIGQPLKTLFRFTGSQFKVLAARIRGPRRPLLIGNHLFVIEHPSIESGGRTVIRVDLTTETVERLVEGTDLAGLIPLSGGREVALSDRGANEVLVVDTVTGKVTQRLSVSAGSPRGIAALGNCLVVGSEAEKRVTFLDRRTGASFREWDLSPVGNKLFGVKSLAVDSASGRVYVRSAYPGNPADPSAPGDRNSVVLIEEPDLTAFHHCVR